VGFGEIVKFVPVILTMCALLPSSAADANDFPTLARVEYILRCMDSNGGQKYETLYSCTCIIDKIADKIAYDEFVEAEVFLQLRSTPGERGGLFRDPDRASLLVRKISDLTEVAKKSCFMGLGLNTTDGETERG
jgi:hypothetical protein